MLSRLSNRLFVISRSRIRLSSTLRRSKFHFSSTTVRLQSNATSSKTQNDLNANIQMMEKAQDFIEEAVTYLDQGQTEHAKDFLLKSIEAYPTPNGFYNLGNIYFQLGQFNEAKENWIKTLQLMPEHADTLTNLGNYTLLIEKNTEQAIEYYQKALKNGGDIEVEFNLGVAYDRSGSLKEAKECYQKCLESGSNNKEWLERVSVMLKNADIRLGHFNKE